MACMLTPLPESRGQRGFAVVTALFILVVLALLGAAVASISSRQHGASAQEINLARARQAARAGLEWGAFAVLAPAAPSATPPACFAGKDIALPGALAGFVVTVRCVRSGLVLDSASPRTLYELQAVACNAPVAGSCAVPPVSPAAAYVEWRMRRTVAR